MGKSAYYCSRLSLFTRRAIVAKNVHETIKNEWNELSRYSLLIGLEAIRQMIDNFLTKPI